MCTIEIPFTGSPDEAFQKVKKEIENSGGVVTGDSHKGSFVIKKGIATFAGNYEFQEETPLKKQTIVLTITKKPPLPTCGQIQKAIEKAIKEQSFRVFDILDSKLD